MISFAQGIHLLRVMTGGSTILEMLRGGTSSPLGLNSSGSFISTAAVALAVAAVSLAFVKLVFDHALKGRLDPQKSLNRFLGYKHICGNVKVAEWQYIGPQENALFWRDCVWRRFRVCSACGECQYWPTTTLQPGQGGDSYRWLTVMFDKLFEEIRKREHELNQKKLEDEIEKRAEKARQDLITKEAAARVAARKESAEKALDFLNAKVQLLSKQDAK